MNHRDPYPHVGIPHSAPVVWLCRPKDKIEPLIRVTFTRWLDARAEGARQLGLEPGQVECIEESSSEAATPPVPAAGRPSEAKPEEPGAAASGEELWDGDTGDIG